MISLEQIKAARGLLDWTQTDLAQKSSLSLTAINNLERKLVLPRMATLEAIRETFEQNGIEFTEGPGVRLRGEPFEYIKFEGADAIDRQTEDIAAHIGTGGYIWNCSSDDANFPHYSPKAVELYLKTMREKKVDERNIMPAGNKNYVSDISTYRWLPTDSMGDMHWTVYADRVCWILWDRIPRVIIIRNATLAEGHRRQFLFLWQHAKEVEK
jgi:transcriptional regulator with XRE-family HTH domain